MDKTQLLPGFAIWLAMLMVVMNRNVKMSLRLAALALMIVEAGVLLSMALETIRVAGLGR